MDDKTRKEIRDYYNGHRDGVSGKEHKSSDVMSIITEAIGMHDRPSNSYSKGFKDGREDRKK